MLYMLRVAVGGKCAWKVTRIQAIEREVPQADTVKVFSTAFVSFRSSR